MPLPAGVSFLADWTADPARGGWGDRQATAADRLAVDTSLTAPGGKPAVRCTVRQGDDPIGAGGERSEVLWMPDAAGATIFEAESATPRFFAFAARFPAGWAGSLDPSGDWSVIYQMHGPDQLRKPGPFAVECGAPAAGQAPVFRVGGLLGDTNGRGGADIARFAWAGDKAMRPGVWSKFVLKFVFSKTAGELRMWRRDEDQADWTEVITRLAAPTLQYSSADSAAAFGKPALPAGSVGEHYFKQGLYRGPGFARTDAYHFSGATARGDTFAAVEAAAFGAAAPAPTPTPTPEPPEGTPMPPTLYRVSGRAVFSGGKPLVVGTITTPAPAPTPAPTGGLLLEDGTPLTDEAGAAMTLD